MADMRVFIILVAWFLQTLYAGRDLNDHDWHTVHIRRRAKHIHLKVDDHPPVQDTLSSDAVGLHVSDVHVGAVVEPASPTPADTSHGRSRNLDFDNIDVAKKPQGDDPNTNLRSRENFVGHMQQLVFNGNHYFELARTGGLQNIKTSATFDKKDKLVKFPVTFSSTQAYLKTSLRIYSTFSIYFQIKTTQPNGLVLYCGGGSGRDFFTVELVKGHVRFIYDTGSGPKVVRSPLVNGINDNKWHDVGILRPTLHQMILRVDDESQVDILPDDRSVHFDTEDMIYIGGIGDDIFNLLPRQVKSREGFQGCLASFDFDGTSRNILEQRTPTPEDFQGDIVEGCHGPASVCEEDSCANRGVCIQEWNSFRCDCDTTSFIGTTCADESLAYTFQNDGGLITFTYPQGSQPNKKKDVITLGFVTTQKDAILARIDSDDSSDYIEMEIVDGHIFVVYNMGTMDHPIGELFERVNDGQYHVVRFTRQESNSTIQVDDHVLQTKNPTGNQLSVFNAQASIHIGGKKSPLGKLVRPFQGTIAGFVLDGLRVLDLAAVGDPRVTIEGDIVLEVSSLRPGVTPFPPTSPVINTPQPEDQATTDMQSTMAIKVTPRGDGVTDDIIFSGAGSGCAIDDEDDCSSSVGSGDRDALVSPVVDVQTTPQPPTTTARPSSSTERSTERPSDPTPLWGSGENPCVDDEDCDDLGSGGMDGDEEESVVEPVSKPKVTTDDIYLTSPEPTQRGHGGGKDIMQPGNNGIVAPKTTTTDPMFITANMTETPIRKPNRATPRWPSVGSTAHPVGAGVPTVSPSGTGVVDNGVNKQRPDDNQYPINIGMFVGIAAGCLLLIFILAYALYKYVSREEGSYKIDESKNYPYESPVSKPSPTVNGGMSKSGMTPPKPAKKKDVKEWYV